MDPVHSFKMPEPSPVNAVKWQNDHVFGSVSENGYIHLWDIRQSRPATTTHCDYEVHDHLKIDVTPPLTCICPCLFAVRRSCA